MSTRSRVPRCSVEGLGKTVVAGLCCGSRLRKGEVFAYVGRNENLKDLKAHKKRLLLGPYSTPMPKAPRWSYVVGSPAIILHY